MILKEIKFDQNSWKKYLIKILILGIMITGISLVGIQTGSRLYMFLSVIGFMLSFLFVTHSILSLIALKNTITKYIFETTVLRIIYGNGKTKKVYYDQYIGWKYCRFPRAIEFLRPITFKSNKHYPSELKIYNRYADLKAIEHTLRTLPNFKELKAKILSITIRIGLIPVYFLLLYLFLKFIENIFPSLRNIYGANLLIALILFGSFIYIGVSIDSKLSKHAYKIIEK